MTNQSRICVSNREMNGYDDSDFFAVFQIEGTNQFEEIMIGSTRFGGGYYHHPVNASKEVMDMYHAWLDEQSAKRGLTIIRIGKKCKISNSKKFKEKQGKVFEIKKSPYDTRVTLATVRFDDYSTTTVDINRIVLV